MTEDSPSKKTKLINDGRKTHNTYIQTGIILYYILLVYYF